MPLEPSITVVMITLNEEHNIERVLENLKGWVDEIILLDSYSKDKTVDLALAHGATVYQRKFTNFGDQWNFAVNSLPITSPWTMKLDPDERITPRLKEQIADLVSQDKCDGASVLRRLWFMHRPLPVTQRLVRLWRTGKCRFTDVTVNEHPIVSGSIIDLAGEIEHHDSPDLEHWYEKQNRYSTAEALIRFEKGAFAAQPKLFGNTLERTMWLKKNFYSLPGRYKLFFLYCYLYQGAWRAGRVGRIWASLRCDVMRMIELKQLEMELTGQLPTKRIFGAGSPDPRVPQY